MAGTKRIDQRQRGIALVTVILALLVLTVLGIAAAVLMTQENRVASRQDQLKAAFYAAEVGLRQGEAVFAVTAYQNALLTGFLQHVSVASTPAAPGAVNPPQAPAPWDLTHLGTYLTSASGGGTELSNQEVTERVGSATLQRVRAYFSLYVRNNPEDRNPATGLSDPTTNRDARLRLVSIGFLTDQNGVANDGSANVLAVKILEEEYNWTTVPQSASAQKGLVAGSTNAGLYGGG